VTIPNKHGVDGFLEVDVMILVNAACIAPSPAITSITSDLAERLQLPDATHWVQLIYVLALDVVYEWLLLFPPM